MKKSIIALAIVAVALLVGCCPGEPKDPNSVIQSNPSFFHKESWNGHVYILWIYGQQGGMTHDPDCPCKEAKKEEHIYENPGR